MSDLEDVLSNLNKIKENMKDAIKFIERLEKLFGGWDASADVGARLVSKNINDLNDWINQILIWGKE